MQTSPEESHGEPTGQRSETSAHDHCKQAEELLRLRGDEPNVPSHVAELVDLYERRGRSDLASSCARGAVARDPEDPRLLRLLGRTLEAGGELDLARAAYLAAVAVGANPRYPEPWLGLARLERAWGRPATAERYARRALDLVPHSAEVYAELARILLQDGQPDRALAAVMSGLQHAPGDPNAGWSNSGIIMTCPEKRPLLVAMSSLTAPEA